MSTKERALSYLVYAGMYGPPQDRQARFAQTSTVAAAVMLLAAYQQMEFDYTGILPVYPS